MKANPIVTAVVIDFKAAKRALKRKQQPTKAERVAVGEPRLTAQQIARRDAVRLAARSAL